MNKIYVVGIGPGAYEKMTIEACETLKNCDVIIGYTVYVDLVKEHFPGKTFLTTPMRKEKERCAAAFFFTVRGYGLAGAEKAKEKRGFRSRFCTTHRVF